MTVNTVLRLQIQKPTHIPDEKGYGDIRYLQYKIRSFLKPKIRDYPFSKQVCKLMQKRVYFVSLRTSLRTASALPINQA